MKELDAGAVTAAFAVNHHPESTPSEAELRKLRNSIRAYLDAALTAEPAPASEREEAVVVKALDWQFHPQAFPPCWCAHTPFGDCVVEEEAGSDSPTYAARGIRMNVVARTEGLPEAKAAAQADFEARIRSALAHPAPDKIAALRERVKAAEAFIAKLVNMQSGAGWTRAVVREAAAAFLREHELAVPNGPDSTPEIVARAGESNV